MLTVRVVAPATVAATGLSARFGARGGTIGRSAECTLVLPDPDQHVSRVQLELRPAGSGWLVVNRGSVNRLTIDGVDVAPGESHLLRDGDEIVVADFVLRVQAAAAAPAADPFGDLVPRTRVAPPERPAAAIEVRDPPAGVAPLGLHGVPAHPGAGSAASPIPADWDPLAGLVPPGAAPVPSDPLAAFDGPRGAVDPLASFDTPRGADPLASLDRPRGADPLASFDRPPAARPIDPLDRPGSADPLAAFDRPGASGRAPGSDPLDLLGPSDRFRPPGPTPAAAAIGDGGIGPVPGESIDELFGLGGPAGGSAAAGSTDPLAPPIATDASMSDHVPEIHSPMPLPSLAPPAPSAVFRSWEAPEEISRTVIVGRGDRSFASPPPDAASPAPAPIIPDAPAPRRVRADVVDPAAPSIESLVDAAAEQHRRDFEPPPATRPTAILDSIAERAAGAARAAHGPPAADAAPGPAADSGDPAERHGAADAAALVAAFLQGAGLAEWPRGGALDAAAMRRLGELMRLMSQGMIDLLAARAAAKGEMRVERTVIASRGNNPLKFLPDASLALPHLLAGQPPRGFTDGRAAVTDAVEDLLAHQAAVVAGMRAAMEGLIARFDPATIEQRLMDRTLLDSVLPGNRKARLWELFGETYGELAREAEDDFEALFGRAFRRAYEAQIERLEQGRPL